MTPVLAMFETSSPIWAWGIFISFVFAMLALDLGVFHRKSHEVGFKESLIWSGIWISLGLAFSILIHAAYTHHWFQLGNHVDPVDKVINNGGLAATKYLTAYIVEKSLSVDNIFVIAMIFGGMAVPPKYQHRVLFWGIIGALAMRGGMISVGTSLVTNFHWVLYVFGAFLLITGIKMFFFEGKETAPEDSSVVKWIQRVLPTTPHYHGKNFLIKEGGKWLLTPLAVTLILIEVTDLIFAVDSIPAVFAITADPFLVFTSNVFAILGLRSLYFALAGLINKFKYLKPALSLILVVIGVKMLAAHQLKTLLGEHFNITVLGVVLAILATGVLTSIAVGRNKVK